jgi:Tfp pilus assembly protein PilN
MMRLGVSVTRDMVSVVAVRGREIIWSGARPCDETSVHDALAEVLRRLPAVPFPRPSVWVALGAPYSHLKTVRKLPETADRRTLGRIVAATPQRFFVGAPGELVTTDIRIVEPGVVSVAALRANLIPEIARALAGRRLRAMTVVPADALADVSVPAAVPDDTTLAYKAATVDARLPVVYRYHQPRPDGYWRRHALASGIAAVVLVMLFAWFPIVSAMRKERQDRRNIATLAPKRARAVTLQRDLSQIARTLTSVNDFERTRHSATLMLARLTDALPAGSALTSLRVDSAGGMFVVLTPRAADVVRRIEGVSGIRQVTVAGAVTHEQIAGQEFDRVTVRFLHDPDPADGREPLMNAPAGSGASASRGAQR